MSEFSPLGTHLGHYKIIKLLNQGGMGQIYLAEDLRLHRTVAIKTLKTELKPELKTELKTELNTESLAADLHTGNTDVNTMENALLEAQLLAKLNHSNIVQIFDITQEEDQICLVMEYLSGKTLHHYQQEHISSLPQKLAIISQISKGLTAAHDQGIVHCDLKPSNIIIDDNGDVKIVDFGIAKLTNRHNDKANNSQSFGSQTAMSPEQLYQALPLDHTNTDSTTNDSAIDKNNDENNKIDFRSDLFSLGIIAFQLISGEHPFWGGTATKTAQNILNAQGKEAQDIVPRLPRELINLLNQLLAHQPESRPKSSQWVTAQFEQITKHLTQQEILAEDTQPITAELSAGLTDAATTNELTSAEYAVEPPIKRHRRKSFIVMTIMLLVTLFIGILTYHDKIFSPTELAPRYIVVLPATITLKDPLTPIADMQEDLVTATIDDAIRQNIINTKGLRLISRSEIEEISKESTSGNSFFANVAAATGANDIITTQLDCNNIKCDVTLSRLTIKDTSKKTTHKWTVLAQRKWPNQIENYYDIYRNTKQNFAMLFSTYTDNILDEQPIKKRDYINYVTLYNKIMIAGDSNDENLNQLQEIITSSPYLYAAYSLYRENALNLFNETNELKYIDRIEKIIAAAPPEYKYSVFQTIDAFAIAIMVGKIDEAKQLLNIAIERGIDNYTLMDYQASLFFNNNEIELAMKQYKTALTLRPSTKLLYNLALSYYWLSDFSNAKETLNKLLKITPKNNDAKRLLAGIYLSEGALKPAIVIYEDVIKQNYQSTDLDNLGLTYTLAGRYQDALRMAELAIELSPNHPTKLLNLADIKMILGFKKEAITHYQRVIEKHQSGNSLKSLLERSQAYAQIGKDKEAVKALNQAKKLAPDNGEVAFAAALVYSLLGENVSAMNQVEEALAAGFGIVWFNLPWFDGLCTNEDFLLLLSKTDNVERCQF